MRRQRNPVRIFAGECVSVFTSVRVKVDGVKSFSKLARALILCNINVYYGTVNNNYLLGYVIVCYDKFLCISKLLN